MMTFPTPEEIAREAWEAWNRRPKKSPREQFTEWVRAGFINAQGQVTKRIGGAAELEPNYETWTFQEMPLPEDAVPVTGEVVDGNMKAPSPRSVERKGKQGKVTWHQLLTVLQQRVGAGQVTTYGECSQWAFHHRGRGQIIRAMLEAAARRGHREWTNRVVRDDGSVAEAADQAHGQLAQLQAEGVPFSQPGRVDLGRCPAVVL